MFVSTFNLISIPQAPLKAYIEATSTAAHFELQHQHLLQKEASCRGPYPNQQLL